MGVIWIASYPKSGNTWVRFLLANAVLGGVGGSEDIERVIPDLERVAQADPLLRSLPRIMAKTHTTFDRQRCRELTERSVYIVRHPKDVALSNLNYRNLLSRRGTEQSEREYLRGFIADGGDATWAHFGFGTLAEHVESWLDRHPHPLLLVKYEQMRADPAAALRGIAAFIGIPLDDGVVERAVAASSFDRMRALEVRERREGNARTVFADVAIGGAGNAKPRYFMNRGATHGSLAHIDPGLDAEFDRRFGGLMARLGYTAG